MIMDQAFTLVYHGKLRYNDLDQMTAEERDWWGKRLKKQKDDEADAMSGS